jgi:glycosyltransferase involved in cell wall biosynthesis
VVSEPAAQPVPARPLRVLLLTDSYWPIVGGGETHSRLVAHTLVQRGTPVAVLTQHRIADSPRHEVDHGVPIERVGLPNRKRFGKYLMMPAVFRRLIARRHDYDVVYCCGLRTLGAVAVLAGRLTGKPVVLRSESCEEFSGLHAFEHLTGATRLAAPLLRLAIGTRNTLLRQADAFMAISTAIADEFRRGRVPDRKITLIYNGIDLSIYRAGVDADEQRSLRAKLGLPADATLLTYTGKLNRGKGLEHLLKAMVDLVAQRPDLHLVLVGAGGHMYLSVEEPLMQFTREHGLNDRVTFTGYRTDVADFLRASDLFVMPSEMEALCISLIEALACGLPSVACHVGGIPDVARHETEALLVAPADPAALRDAISRLLDDAALRERLVEAGRTRVAERFDIHAVAAQHEALFTSLVNARRKEYR